MKFILVILPFFLLGLNCVSQEELIPFEIGDGNAPYFKEGDIEMAKFLSENIVYPQEAVENEEQGIVFLEFIVRKTDDLDSVKVVKSVSKSIDEEAIWVIKLMPKWVPGRTSSGEEVDVRYTIPIRFKLDLGATNDENETLSKKEKRKMKRKRN